MYGEQKAEAKAVEEGEEVSARLEQAVADKKQLEEDAFQVTKVRIVILDVPRDAARPNEACGCFYTRPDWVILASIDARHQKACLMVPAFLWLLVKLCRPSRRRRARWPRRRTISRP